MFELEDYSKLWLINSETLISERDLLLNLIKLIEKELLSRAKTENRFIIKEEKR